MKQKTTAGGSGISWTIHKSLAPRSRQITMPAPHHSVFLQTGCSTRRSTNSVKAPKAKVEDEVNTYKLCILMYNIRAGKCPCYLRDIMQPTIARVTRSGLRSHSDTTSYVTPRLRTKFGERAFSFSGPAAWNSLETR